MLRLLSFSILCSITVCQILLISFYLFIKKKGNALSKTLIISLLIAWAVFITGSLFLLIPGQTFFFYDIGHLMNLTVFLIAPILYLHFNTLFVSEYKLTIKDLTHTLIFVIIFSYIFYQNVIEREIAYVFYPRAIYLISFLYIQNILYFYLIIKKLRSIPEKNGNKHKLAVYKFLMSSALIIFSLKLIIFIIWNILQYTDICVVLTGIFFAVVFIILNSLMIYSLNNPDILLVASKYQGYLISEEELNKTIAAIEQTILNDKLFLDPLISLERLSKILKIQEKILSQIINQTKGLNFNDFINKYRISHAQILIESCEHKTILEVAFECGFNSKSTFNSAFKKFTNLTPTGFKRNLQNIS